MGGSGTKIEKEKQTNLKLEGNFHGIKPVPVSYIEQIKKSICKIIINEKEKEKGNGTGFFMIINSYNYLITCYHVIENISNNIIPIEIWNKNIYNININNNSAIIDKDLDVVLIDIKESNINNIDFLYYDENYKYGYPQYQNLDIFTLSYQLGNELVPTSGKFLQKTKKKDYLFLHNIDTEGGSSGSPIILFTKKVVGIHQGYAEDINLNAGIFIGEIVNVFNKSKNIKNEKKPENEINLLDSNFDKKNNSLIKFNEESNSNEDSNTMIDLKSKYNNCCNISDKKKNFTLINNTKFIFDTTDSSSWFQKVKPKLFCDFANFEGFQLYRFKSNRLIGAIEGPPETFYENGFFLFEMTFPSDYLFKPPKFKFITKIFHPNISEIDGLVSVDIL